MTFRAGIEKDNRARSIRVIQGRYSRARQQGENSDWKRRDNLRTKNRASELGEASAPRSTRPPQANATSSQKSFESRPPAQKRDDEEDLSSFLEFRYFPGIPFSPNSSFQPSSHTYSAEDSETWVPPISPEFLPASLPRPRVLRPSARFRVGRRCRSHPGST